MSAIDYKRQATVGVEDLVLLPTIGEKPIFENIKLRHSKDLIYTNIGNVLISVNPFKRMPIYTEEQIQFYRVNGRNTTIPHIFQLAEETYRQMINEEENQCVIISGESGAGKTEASKQIMQYIAAVSGNSAEMQRVKHIMLESNPLLEAFGNAKTVRNDNSSRFGKFFEMYFDRVGGPLGGKMSNFLLEKTRVVRQQRGERNFHIFYQLCCGLQEPLRSQLRIKPPGEFHFLKQGQTLERAGVDDAAEWRETESAMDTIGITAENKRNVLELLSAILWLGELKFEFNGDKPSISNKDDLAFVSGLLKVDPVALERSFCWKTLKMVNEIVNVPHDQQQCNNAREALAKALYDKIFNYVVDSVNTAFGKRPYALMLGVLDIYGFEIFEKNGFEQFCINFVNEKLQQIFIELTLKVEQEEYVREKIAWEEIKFFNNKVVCELIEGKQPPGLFSIIDDVCAAMAKEQESAADLKLLDKLDGVHLGHPHFRRSDRGFTVKHYAGDVFYDTAGFTQRNKDLLSNDTMLVIIETKSAFLAKLTEDIPVDIDENAKSPTARASSPRGKKITAGFRIKTQAEDLVKTLRSCNPHYVRTIKSNDEKRANFIDDARVLHQCKYLGLLENVRVRRAGFAYRQYFDKFVKRFKYTCPATFPKPFRGTDKAACGEILKHNEYTVPAGGWQLGETKLFIRHPQHLFAMEELRERSFDGMVGKIQRAWIRYRNNKEYIVLKKNMDRIYGKAAKERRADSVFRPYLGEYINYHTALSHVHHLIEYDPVTAAWKEHWADGGKKYYYNTITGSTVWLRPAELDKQRVVFTDKVDRVVQHNAGQKAKETLVLTDRALYLIEEQQHTIQPPTEPKTKQNPRPVAPPPYTVTRFVLKKRLDIRLMSGVSVSLLADTFCIIHFYSPPVPYRTVTMTPAPKGAFPCQGCGEKLTPAAKKGNCPGCGLLLCLKTCLIMSRALPMLGYPKVVPVCPNCFESAEAHEAVEDVVISMPGKTELVAMVRKVYKRQMGSKIPINCNNSIEYRLAGEANARVANFFVNPALKDTELFVQPNQLVVHTPGGIAPARIAAIEEARDARRKIAQEKYKAQQADQKRLDEQKEAEREAQRRKQIEDRKQGKKDAEEREERERLEKDRAAREQRERSARLVSERTSK